MGVTVKLFADDVKVYIRIVGNCDADMLQHALELGRYLAINHICEKMQCSKHWSCMFSG